MLPSSGLSTGALRLVASRLLPEVNFKMMNRPDIIRTLVAAGITSRDMIEARLSVFVWSERRGRKPK